MKEKIYYFQEKSNDILDLQDDFTTEEIGIYFILKAAYFKYAGELKEENLCQRCKFFGNKEKLNDVKNKIFELKEGLLVNNAWLSEIKDIKDRSEKRRLAALGKWEKSKTKAKPKQTKSKTEANKNDNFNPNVNENLKSQLENLNVNLETWQDFVYFRTDIKKPVSELALKQILKKLKSFESKQTGFANLALENSIANSWQGVFEPNQKNNLNQIITKEKTLTLGEQFNKFMEYDFCKSINEEQGVLKVNMRSPHFIKQIELSDDLMAKVNEFFNNKKFELICL